MNISSLFMEPGGNPVDCLVKYVDALLMYGAVKDMKMKQRGQKNISNVYYINH